MIESKLEEVYEKPIGPPITTYEGFLPWRAHQGMDANLGTAIMSRRFKEVPMDELRRWFDVWRTMMRWGYYR